MTNAEVRLGGGVIYWSLSRWCQLDKLQLGWEEEGLGKFVPEHRTPVAALKDALAATFTERHTELRAVYSAAEGKARHIDGYAVYEERPGEFSSVLRHKVTAKIDKDSVISFWTENGSSLWLNDADRVKDQFNLQLGLVKGEAVSGAMVDVLAHLGGISLRPNGSIYWLPDSALDRWQRAAAVVEQCSTNGKSAVYLLRHRMDEQAVRAVHDAVLREISQEVERINREVVEDDLGKRGLETREQQALHLMDRVSEFESLLGLSLQEMREAAEAAKTAAAMAALSLAS